MRPRALQLAACLLALGAGEGGCQPLNCPYPAVEDHGNILYSSFGEAPKNLDPAIAYNANEYSFISQVYEPPLQYHFLKRPYALEPLTLAEMPRAVELAGGRVAYECRLKPGIRFQDHPCFAKDASGRPRYVPITPEDADRWNAPMDFPEKASRELTADDYVHGIRRLANPMLACPIRETLVKYLLGMDGYVAALQKELDGERARRKAAAGPAYNQALDERADPLALDLSRHPFPGVERVDRYTFRIVLKTRYPQILYWMAMPFFAPMPPEAEAFYAQALFAERNLTLSRYPVGTGPFSLTVYDKNRRMVLSRNPHYREDLYPAEGEAGDREAGFLADAGRRLPFLDEVVYSLEKEAIPSWQKFLQGYYDASGISSDNFDQAVRMGMEGEATLTSELESRGISLRTSVGTGTFYLAFNFLDPVVGGLADRARKLRQAISIALDWEEFISIFSNGRGIPGSGPIPPGIFGYRDGREGMNPVVYDWVDGKPGRKPIEAAQKLLAEAGFPGGREAKSGQPLVLYLDTVARGPGDAARLNWYRRQFAKLDIQLEIRTSDWNRFQEKIRSGNTQMFFLGWNADYPDPENFMFLLNGPQSRAKTQGENAANYRNPAYDRLFERMKNMDNGPQRQAVIDEMVRIAREDAPWAWGYHPKDYGLSHAWIKNGKPNNMARNGLKFQRIDTALREQRRAEWNRPVVWPLILAAVLLVLATLPAFLGYRRRERAVSKGAAGEMA